jgi:predicted adenine nucleotide alpha hydrolase (AANH) superfamily ATPase
MKAPHKIFYFFDENLRFGPLQQQALIGVYLNESYPQPTNTATTQKNYAYLLFLESTSTESLELKLKKCCDDLTKNFLALIEERLGPSFDKKIGTCLSNSRHLADHPAANHRKIIALPATTGSKDRLFAEQMAQEISSQPTIINHEKTFFNDQVIFLNPQDSQLKHAIHERVRKKRMLLHVCCGPDAAGVIEQLKKEFELICFWYDPNIQPKQEHDKRLEAFIKVCEIKKAPYIIGEYDVDNFFSAIKGLEHTPEQGAKCSNCYDMRLERAVIEAKKQNCDLYTTTLAISPHKVQQKLKNFGEVNQKRHGIPYLAKNFVKDDGFKNSISFTREHNIYRQDYCGCFYSLHEGGTSARWLHEKWQSQTQPINPSAISDEFFIEYQEKLSKQKSSKLSG